MGCAFCVDRKDGARAAPRARARSSGRSACCAAETGRAASRNIVLMGMGEPLAQLRRDDEGAAGPGATDGVWRCRQRMTLSTVGVVPEIERLGREPVMPNLAVSLHATTDETRDRAHADQPASTRSKSCSTPAGAFPLPAAAHHVRVRAARRRERHARGRAASARACFAASRPRSTCCR